jgi:chromate transporter
MQDCLVKIANSDTTSSWSRRREVALAFLRLGTTAFGGPAAHVSMMEDEFVRRRQWVSHERFLDMLGAVNLIPGPNSTEMAIYLGYLRAGWIGLLLGGVCFVLPAMLIVTGIAWAYVLFGSLPQVNGLLAGVKPVIIAVILQALVGLGPKAVKTLPMAALAAAAMAAALGGLDPLSLLLLSGLIVGLACGAMRIRPRPWRGMFAALLVAGSALALIHGLPRIHAAAAATPANVGLWPIFLYFVKIGSVMYGSGYVLLAFLQGDLVTRWSWLSAQQLLDATAVGQVTPGPLFTTATFIGFVLGHRVGGLTGGLLGALLATIGIFLPSFVFIAIGGPLFPRLRQSRLVGAILDGVNVAALALIAATMVQLGRDALVDRTTVAVAVVSAVLLMRFRVSSALLVLAGAVIGLLFYS